MHNFSYFFTYACMYRTLAWIICTMCNKVKSTTGQCEPKRNIWNLITSPYPALLCRKAFQFCGDRLPSERTIGALVWGAGPNWGQKSETPRWQFFQIFTRLRKCTADDWPKIFAFQILSCAYFSLKQLAPAADASTEIIFMPCIIDWKNKKMLPVLQICYTNWNFSYYQIFKPECLSFVGVKYKGVFLLNLIQFLLVYYFRYSIQCIRYYINFVFNSKHHHFGLVLEIPTPDQIWNI